MRRAAVLLVAVLVTTLAPAVAPATAGAASFLDHRALLGDLAEPEWYEANIPFLDVPDQQLRDVYYYRWSTYKRHLRYTDRTNGYVITEFHNPPGYSAPLGGIVAAAGHHIAEGRWLRDRRPVDDYLRYWLQGPGASEKPREDYVNEDTDDWAHQYAFWAASSAYQRYLVTGDRASVVSLLPDLVRQYDKWAPQFNPELGLYWSVPVWDAMEYTASAYETDPADPYHGGHGYRPTLNAYQYGDARAIAAIARLAGDRSLARRFDARADALSDAVHEHLWGGDFFHHKARADLDPSESLVADREQIGYLPWMFGMDRPSDDVAWRFLTDPQGFAAPYGPTTVERRSEWFMHDALTGCCRWNGPSWPFSTSQTLTGLANLLNSRPQPYVSRDDYYDLLRGYALTQYKNGEPYVAEAHHPDENRWIYDGRGHSEHYNHSTFTDLVINGLIGVRPGDPLVVNPLVPLDWDWFALENVPYRGHDVTVLWDRDGSRYGQGAGLRVYVDGRVVAARSGLGRLAVPVPTRPVSQPAEVNDASNPSGAGYPRPFASYTNAIDDAWDVLDGRVYYDDVPHSRWTNYNSPNVSDHLGVDFGVPTPVRDVRMYLYDDGGGVRTPASYEVEYWTGSQWQVVQGQHRSPLAGNTLNRITFPPVTTTRLRVRFENPPGAKVGVTELGVWSPVSPTLTLSDSTTTYTNGTGRVVKDVRVTLAVPPGWRATPVTPATAAHLRPGARLVTRWTITPPDGLAPGDYPIRAFTSTTSSEYGVYRVPFDPANYPVVDLAGLSTFTAHQPFPGEAVPSLSVDGALTATGTSPYFALVSSGVAPSSPHAVSLLTVGAFTNTGAPEDSVFVGWVKDKDNYVTAWYNNTRRSSGINVRVNGQFLNTPGDAPVTLSPGDQFALLHHEGTITSYAKTGGTWRSLRTTSIGDALTPDHHYGLGVRASNGTLTVTNLTGLGDA
jgi:hypothetical protein